MTDNWDEMTELLKKDTAPVPREGAKNEAISKAMMAFEKKHAKQRQGTGFLNRLMDAVRISPVTFSGDQFMKTSYVLAGGAAIALVTVALLHTTSLTDMLPRPQPVQKQSMQAQPPATAPAQVKTQDAAKDTGATLNAVAVPKAENEAAPTKPEGMLAAAPAPAPAMPAPQPMEKKPAMLKSRAMQQNVEADVMSSTVGRAAAPKMAAGAASSPVMAEARLRRDAFQIMPQPRMESHDQFQKFKENPVKLTAEEPVSTFSIDVDTSSYSFLRSTLNRGAMPDKDAVRVEEMINYFPYEYEAPKSKDEPFKANVTVMPSPWNPDAKLLHIGIKGYQLEQKEKPHSNLVFLIDTSGSMNGPDRLPLVISSLKMLLSSLKPDDTVGIVTYAGNAGVALEPTKISDKAKIISALESLTSYGSTAGAEGIRQAYRLAEEHFDKKGVNRVILATDGDFNVGISDPQELKNYISKKRDSGVFLSVLGVGHGNYNDAIMQSLAQNGNGNAAYIDTLSEARKVLVEEAGSTLFPIAKDVKIQIEFNPAKVAEYRLIGYETRLLAREDFNNDKVDAGDIGAGHAVTAIYEITPVGSKTSHVDPLRYQKEEKPRLAASAGGEYAFVKIRYKLPQESTSKLISTPVDDKAEYKTLAEVPKEARFAVAVAAFGQKLRDEPYTQSFSYDDVLKLAEGAKGADAFGYRAEFINLVRLAKSSAPEQQPGNPEEE